MDVNQNILDYWLELFKNIKPMYRSQLEGRRGKKRAVQNIETSHKWTQGIANSYNSKKPSPELTLEQMFLVEARKSVKAPSGSIIKALKTKLPRVITNHVDG